MSYLVCQVAARDWLIQPVPRGGAAVNVCVFGAVTASVRSSCGRRALLRAYLQLIETPSRQVACSRPSFQTTNKFTQQSDFPRLRVYNLSFNERALEDANIDLASRFFLRPRTASQGCAGEIRSTAQDAREFLSAVDARSSRGSPRPGESRHHECFYRRW
jgi:hypothetical protein